MKTVLRVTRQSLEPVLVCSYSLSGLFGFNFVSATDYKPPGMPAPPPRQFSTNQPSRTIYRVYKYTAKLSGCRGTGGNQGGTGSNGGPSVLRNKTTAPKTPTLLHCVSGQFTVRVQWQMYLEQGGVMGGALGGIVPTGMSLALMVHKVLGTFWYFAIHV